MSQAKTRKPKRKLRTCRTPPEVWNFTDRALDAGGRAQLGRDEEKRRERPRQDDASVEDALQDWSDDA